MRLRLQFLHDLFIPELVDLETGDSWSHHVNEERRGKINLQGQRCNQGGCSSPGYAGVNRQASLSMEVHVEMCWTYTGEEGKYVSSQVRGYSDMINVGYYRKAVRTFELLIEMYKRPSMRITFILQGVSDMPGEKNPRSDGILIGFFQNTLFLSKEFPGVISLVNRGWSSTIYGVCILFRNIREKGIGSRSISA